KFAHEFPLEFDTNVWHRFTLAYTASNQTLTLTKLRDGVPFGLTNTVALGAAFTDFRLDTVAIASYSDAGQGTGSFAGSILAHGAVDNLVVTVPDAPVTRPDVTWSNGLARVRFGSRSNWLYTLTRSADLAAWSTLSATTNGNGGTVELSDGTAAGAKTFYRVKAERP
ncbi:MAG: hypothetical protein HY301_13040, partial [Verrucomicrobia bacterium]|nr:hypothetical protein [Verrucomicrobiota bacterium]